MTFIEKFERNLKLIEKKYNGSILKIDNEYVKVNDKTLFYCNKHKSIFISSIRILLDINVTCGCNLCKLEKLSESGIKGSIVRLNKKNNK